MHFAAEWFSSVGEYLILRPEPAPVAGRAETIPLEYRGEARRVVNYGVGVEQRLSESLVAYGGAARNHSAYVPQRDGFSAWDLNDVTAGVTLDVGSRRLAFGLGYAWGAKALPQVVVPPTRQWPRLAKRGSAVGRSLSGRRPTRDSRKNASRRHRPTRGTAGV
jgi:hypothetical protein